MEIVIFFFITWLAVFMYCLMQKELTLVESTFVFLIVLVVSINFSWIIMEELKLIKLTEKGLPYTAFLLNRSIIIPILILMQLNFLVKSESHLMKTAILFSSVLALVGVSFLSSSLNITEFTKWNLGYEAIYYLCLNLIGMIALKIMKSIPMNAVNHS
ncbi:hypothetical protein [Virgibacillus sp. L01]|uniref:hypothetical protein n=1 Tax=Virgibacillus sp. L01 TaxID=3457429 RepID=UPI003FCF7D67